MSDWIDLTLALSNASVVWPGDPAVSIEPAQEISRGAPCNESRIAIGSHCGTHIDAPRHFDPNGASIDELDPRILVGPAWVLDCSAASSIGLDHLERVPEGEFGRVLLKTRNSAFLGRAPFREDYVGLSEEGAQYLVSQGCRLVGIDYHSICPFQDAITTHRVLLGRGIVILEALMLDQAPAGPVDLIALPLKIRGGDAAPARVLVRERTRAEK